MAICDYCDKEMTKHVSCEEDPIVFPDGTTRKQIKWEPSDGEDCHDCGTPYGGFHHPGCDTEKCPRCGSQLISCGCL